jgi:hypothetical protein
MPKGLLRSSHRLQGAALAPLHGLDRHLSLRVRVMFDVQFPIPFTYVIGKDTDGGDVLGHCGCELTPAAITSIPPARERRFLCGHGHALVIRAEEVTKIDYTVVGRV